MELIRKYRIYIIFLILIGITGLVTGTFLDRDISSLLYHKNELFCSVLEAVCFFPIYFPVILFFTVLYTCSSSRWLKSIFFFLLVLGIFIMVFVGLHYLQKRSFLLMPLYISIPLIALGAIAIGIFLIRIISLKDRKTLQILLLVAVSGILYLMWELLFAQSLKILSGRPRYEELLENNSLYFTKWYIFSGQGGSSFPSGHTAQSCGILLMLLYPLLFTEKRNSGSIYISVSFIFILLTSFTRIVLGKHFLSDVSFSVTFMGAGFLLLLKVIGPIDAYIKKKLPVTGK